MGRSVVLRGDRGVHGVPLRTRALLLAATRERVAGEPLRGGGDDRRPRDHQRDLLPMTVLPGVLAASPPADRADPEALRHASEREARLKSIVAEHYAFLWRLLRRLGVTES